MVAQEGWRAIAAGGLLREGRDFTNAAELAERLAKRAGEWVRRSAGEELTACALRELYWLERFGGLPGGVSWDNQPAWRVELWEEFLVERERSMAAAMSMGGL